MHSTLQTLRPVALMAACACLLVATPARAADTLTPWAAPGDAPAPWHVSGLPRQTKPFTKFTVETANDKSVLKIEADKSYGNLLHPVSPTTDLHHLSWRWTVDEPNMQADLRQKSGEDEAVRVCVLFDLPLEKVPLVERTLMRMNKTSSGEAIPGATICYVWDQKYAAGTSITSPFTSQMRMLVLRGKDTPLHEYVGETRDVEADFKRLFGDESPTVPPVIGVAVGADADNTQGHSVAHVGPLTLAP